MYAALATIIDLLCRSLRMEFRNERPIQSFINGKKTFVIVFWHGSMFLGWWWMRKYHPAALVSQSKDGQHLSAVLQRWNFHLIRGSSSRGGKEAMESMVQAIQDGYNLCVTPDGPKGPVHIMKMGAVRAAQKTGVPLFILDVSLRHKKHLKSWDAFAIPYPFTTCILTASDPIFIEPTLSGDDLEEKRKSLEEQMRTMHSPEVAHY